MPKRKLLVVAEDKDVAEVAAVGLRMYEGWEPVIATTAAQAVKAIHDEPVAGIVNIVVQPRENTSRTISKLSSLATGLRLPFFGITPDKEVLKQFRLLGVSAYCTPFDPIHMWSLLPESIGLRIAV